MLRPLHAIVDELVSAEIALGLVRAEREAAVALLTDADGRLARAKARTSGLREELEAHITDRVGRSPTPRRGVLRGGVTTTSEPLVAAAAAGDLAAMAVPDYEG